MVMAHLGGELLVFQTSAPPPPPCPQAAFMVMAHLGGKLLVFQSSAPSLGIGKVKNRDVANLYNTGGCRVQG